jgi:UPF0755 protein
MRQRWLMTMTVGLVLAACGPGPGNGDVRRVHIPAGSHFRAVADSLEAQGVIRSAPLFRLYARFAGDPAAVQAGTYEFREGETWRQILEDLSGGRIVADRLVVPEGWDIQRIGPVLARLAEQDPDSVITYMLDTAAAHRFQVPGPNLEGYLYPATYTVPAGAPLDSIIVRMVRQYRSVWTAERRERAAEMGLDEREVVTLASIVEKEARVRDEMPLMAAVFLNRLRIGYPLQADPTVQYALGEHQNRLLYAHIDQVADHPYNTYTQPGIPPGPIGSPSARAIDAILNPADVDYLYFVARPDGSHVFNRHLADHNRARAEIRREIQARADQRAREAARSQDPAADSSP